MAMKPEHASADLALGMRYNTLVDCSDDIDPETLHSDFEEEEEEEDEDEDPDDEAGDDDRGDDIDPDLTETEGDPDDEPGDDDKDDADDPDAEDDPDLDADALAELAEGGKSKVVPHSRFHEVNESLKQERAERLRLEEENARLKGAAPKPEEQKPETPAAYDFDAAEDRYMTAVMEGDTDKAKVIRREIRAEELKIFEGKAGQDAKKAAEEELQKRDQSAETERLQKVLDDALAKYPFLNNDSDEANQDAIEDVIARRDHYLRQGMSPSKAVAAAVEKIAPRYAPAAEEQPGDKSKPVKEKPALGKDKIDRNVERQRSIPPVMPGVGERGKDVDYADLSEDEFDALPESEKRKARGDFVSERD
ncbi:hypothetical protein CDR19_04375 [Ectopseudomonas toyotomiensis]|uniref:Uncharacterized protein n=1 Tax=Ectopseudomonas toyotomiensis TaxID=554344 RepID=A0A1I5R3J9_9GAMM|nr:hypothetical protein [Pseudomonas toyotomiensis]PIA74305.1 hypothetical protein CDR19_04375 [Pseudomonas toyotomiensis]SFP52636.1 hypothetical protein SAMN05216177_103255 [Pseudomonas toyotomiensis]